ncbi:MAG TPA: Asp23/Gls24 family envelope stress response protein [Atribacteraceae bacterium]|nr:Asp23/Gls24 family envelope stress response protein [Atribacteraceae bacterium]
MKYVDVATAGGKVTFPMKVLLKIARRIILSVPGVDSLEKNNEDSIKIEVQRNVFSFNLYLVFNLSKRVPEVSWNLQRKLKECFEGKTGLRVERINVHIQEFSAFGLNNEFQPPPFLG